MSYGVALFLFLAAAAISIFAFLSVAVWVSAPAQERQARDRLALLKSLAEHSGENAQQVLALLREEDERRRERKQREERRGFILGGLITMAVGAGLGLMLLVLGSHGAWSIGLIPFLIGCVLLGAGLTIKREKASGLA
jgi:hypothetical protein